MLDKPSDAPPFRLTSLAHGGGCGCKLSPSVLRELLAEQPLAGQFERLLVGSETADDAAVWKLDDETCLIATTDFFMPMVDDPFVFGRVAATNAISDIYAMGGKPILALAILGMPLGKLEPEIAREILKGGASIAAEAGIPVAGGHSIDSPEPIYGLAVIGTAKPEHIRKNSGARAGDALILTKPLGVGVYSAAFKKDALPPNAYAEMIASMTLLNRVGSELGKEPNVHAMTDVTGFGILGHALEMARGSGVAIDIEQGSLPWLADAETLARQGFVTGASHRNWASYGDAIKLPDGLPDWRRHLLADPQTSGGLLVACAPEAAENILKHIRSAGYSRAALIGRAVAGEPSIRIIGAGDTPRG